MKEKIDTKSKKANIVIRCICIGMIVGSILSAFLDNIYLLTIGAGIGSGIGLMYIRLKYTN